MSVLLRRCPGLLNLFSAFPPAWCRVLHMQIGLFGLYILCVVLLCTWWDQQHVVSDPTFLSILGLFAWPSLSPCSLAFLLPILWRLTLVCLDGEDWVRPRPVPQRVEVMRSWTCSVDYKLSCPSSTLTHGPQLRWACIPRPQLTSHSIFVCLCLFLSCTRYSEWGTIHCAWTGVLSPDIKRQAPLCLSASSQITD